MTRFNKALALTEQVGSLPGTRFDAIPMTGAANFSGYGLMTTDATPNKANDSVYMLGDANLRVDFGQGSVKGTVTNFRGARGNVTDINSNKSFDVGGRIDLGADRSYIGDDPDEPADNLKPNEFYTSYSGELTVPGSTYIYTSGGLFGQFRGTTGNNAIKGLTARDPENVDRASNGRQTISDFEIVATNPAAP
tara:strand:- start:1385 stop:1963 length:579 start_codon:yes stop_codon:yes gene_type:complete